MTRYDFQIRSAKTSGKVPASFAAINRSEPTHASYHKPDLPIQENFAAANQPGKPPVVLSAQLLQLEIQHTESFSLKSMKRMSSETGN